MKKGPLAEAQIVAFLQENGFPLAERRVMGGSRDRGDVAGIPGLVIEIKNQAKLTLAEWVDEANTEANRNYPAQSAVPRDQWSFVEDDRAVVWHKRRGRGSPGDWYVTMDGHTFVELLKAWTK